MCTYFKACKKSMRDRISKKVWNVEIQIISQQNSIGKKGFKYRLWISVFHLRVHYRGEREREGDFRSVEISVIWFLKKPIFCEIFEQEKLKSESENNCGAVYEGKIKMAAFSLVVCF